MFNNSIFQAVDTQSLRNFFSFFSKLAKNKITTLKFVLKDFNLHCILLFFYSIIYHASWLLWDLNQAEINYRLGPIIDAITQIIETRSLIPFNWYIWSKRRENIYLLMLFVSCTINVILQRRDNCLILWSKRHSTDLIYFFKVMRTQMRYRFF